MGTNLGTMPTTEALKMARGSNLDLVEVSPGSRPPVCRIMDYGKYKYEQKMKEKKQKSNQRISKVKTVKIRPKIDPHDAEVKLNACLKFLEAGNKVHLKLFFRGREKAHRNVGLDVFKDMIESMKESGDPQKINYSDVSVDCLVEPK